MPEKNCGAVSGVKIGLTESAYLDLRDIESYVSQSSHRMGRSFTNKILKKIEMLYEHPRIGRKVPEFNQDNIRELIQGKYRIVYRIKDDSLIEILRIVHGSKLIDLEWFFTTNLNTFEIPDCYSFVTN